MKFFKKFLFIICISCDFKKLHQKNLIKLFYTLEKASLGETGCLSNHYYRLAAEASRTRFQNCSLKKCIFEKSFF